LCRAGQRIIFPLYKLIGKRLPEKSGLLVEVTWTGHDGGSGLERYDVEYWEESTGWTDLLTDTLDIEAMFMGEAGVSYTVRVTGRDRVGNETQAEKTVEVLDVVWRCQVLHFQWAKNSHAALCRQ
jgi:hypothetical protein